MNPVESALSTFAHWANGMASVSIGGLPAGALGIALFIATLEETRKEASGRQIPERMRTAIVRAFIAGYLALGIVKLAPPAYMLHELGITAWAGLLTIIVPWLRKEAPGMARDVWQIVITWLRQRFGVNNGDS